MLEFKLCLHGMLLVFEDTTEKELTTLVGAPSVQIIQTSQSENKNILERMSRGNLLLEKKMVVPIN